MNWKAIELAFKSERYKLEQSDVFKSAPNDTSLIAAHAILTALERAAGVAGVKTP